MFNKLKNLLVFINLKVNNFSEKFRITNVILKKIVPIAVFLISLHFFYYSIGIYKHVTKRPCSIHTSAQCQRASVALNYHENEMNFFKPMVQKDISGDGVTGLEFPIVYYTAAVLYKMFGFNDYYIRIINLILFTIGITFFYLLVLRFIKNIILALGIVSAVICSTVLLFYTANFMPDVPSFILGMSAWYFFFEYLRSDKKKHLNWFVFFATLAALIKSIAIINFVVIICLLVLDYLKYFKKADQPFVFKNRVKIFMRIVLGFCIVLAWYWYATWLSKANNNETFSLSPVMVKDIAFAKEVLEVVGNLWLFDYYSYETYVFIGAIIIIFIISYKFVNRFLFTITLLYVLGCTCYVYFFLKQFMWHDYYIIAILPCVFFLFVTFADLINTISEKYFSLTKFALFVVIFFNVKECYALTKKNYNERYGDWAIEANGNLRQYEDLEFKLRKLGIKRQDRILFAFDDSFCNQLYMANSLGYSFGSLEAREKVVEIMTRPRFKYLVLNDSAKFNKFYGKDLSDKILSTHRGLIIYKLH